MIFIQLKIITPLLKSLANPIQGFFRNS